MQNVRIIMICIARTGGSIMLCKKCQFPISDSMKFCTNCGEPNPGYIEAEASLNETVDGNVVVDDTVSDVAPSDVPKTWDSTKKMASSEAGTQESASQADSSSDSNQVGESDSDEKPVGAPIGVTPGTSHFADYAEKPKNNGKKAVIIGGIAALAIAGVAVGAVTMMGNINPTDRFKKVVTSSANKSIDSYTKTYEKYLEAAKLMQQGATESTMTIDFHESDLTDTMFSFAQLFGGVNINWLKQIRLDAKAVVNNEEATTFAEFFINEKSALTTDIYMGEDKFLVQMPELSSDYLDFAGTISQQMDMSTLISIQTGYIKAVPDSTVLNRFLHKYATIWLDDIKDVKSEKSDVTAMGITQSATKLTATLQDEEVRKLYIRLLEELKKDEDLKNMVINYVDNMNPAINGMNQSTRDGESVYKDMITELETEIAKANENKDASRVVTITLWVDGNTIIATDVRADSDSSKFHYVSKTPRKGTDIGLEYAWDSTDSIGTQEKGKIEGNAKYDSGKLSGLFALYADDEHIMDFDLKNFDLKKYESGEIVMDLELSMLDGTSLSDSIGVSMKDYSLLISMSGTSKESKVSFVVKSKGQDAITIASTSKYIGKLDVVVPSGNFIDANDQEKSMEYLQNANWDNLFAKLRGTDIPSEYIDALEATIKASFGVN